jgi:hypothetical protein
VAICHEHSLLLDFCKNCFSCMVLVIITDLLVQYFHVMYNIFQVVQSTKCSVENFEYITLLLKRLCNVAVKIGL